MKNLVLRYGLYSAGVMVGVFLFTFFFVAKESEMGYKIAEIVGYSTILLSMVFVFLGIKKYRDENNGGSISFGEALKVGILIVLIPSVAFGLYNLFYIEVLDPNFMENYYQYSLEEYKASLEPADFEAMKAKMEKEKAMFQNTGMQFFLMFLTVFIIGFIVSLISSMILKREKGVNDSFMESNA